MDLAPNVGSDRSWVWTVAADMSEGESRQETMAIRFANSESEFEACCSVVGCRTTNCIPFQMRTSSRKSLTDTRSVRTSKYTLDTAGRKAWTAVLRSFKYIES